MLMEVLAHIQLAQLYVETLSLPLERKLVMMEIKTH